MNMIFDTLRFSQRLQQVGVSRDQADVHAELARDMIIADGATKDDVAVLRAEIADVKAELKAEIVDVRKEIKTESVHLEQRMTIKLGTMMAAMTGLIIAAQQLLK